MNNQHGYTLNELLFLLVLASVGLLFLGIFVKLFRWVWGF